MKRLWFNLAILALIVTTFWTTLGVSGGVGDDQQGSHRENFRVTVTKLIHEEDIIVTQVEIEARPGCYVEVVSDKQNRGGVGAASSEPSQANRSPRTRLTIVGDHVVWDAGSVNALKFLMRIASGSSTAAMTNTGPMPRDKRLAEAVSVLIEPGEYGYGEVSRLVRFQDVTYSLVVKSRK